MSDSRSTAQRKAPWKKWGPYLSERQWGTVREDYSDDGDAWNYFTHDQARSRAYRWGEDGLAGISDDQQRLCFALALWNGKDPILKERLFGLTNSEGNHGEDVKEYYFYLDSHADALVHEVPVQVSAGGVSRTTTWSRRTARRGRHELEYELLDTGVFDDDRYFDVFVEYAKASPEDILIQITRAQPRPRSRPTLHVLPTLWFRNTWSWGGDGPRPSCCRSADGPMHDRRHGIASSSGERFFYCDGAPRRCCSPRTKRTTSASSAVRTARRT